MKEQTKIKLRKGVRAFVSSFALYALLPMICCGLLALLLLFCSVGEREALSVLSSLGEESVAAVAGELLQKEIPTPRYYFLSGNLRLPFSHLLSASYGTTEKVPPKEEEKEELPSYEIRYDSLPAGAVPVVKSDLSSPSYLINTTNYSVDPQKAREALFPSGTDKTGGPLVLVLHSHGTESYFEDRTNLSEFAEDPIESYFVEGETLFRTTDPEKSVVAVGQIFCQALEEAGIPTLHCTVMHDKDDFNQAYVNSAETVKAYLERYPSIQYVIDLHRDAVVRGSAYVKSYTEIDGESAAQVMLVVGTNQNGRHPQWEKNLAVAVAFKDQMDALFPTLSRSLYLRTARFNQEYLPGCMLLEVGSAANSLAEAKTAARLAARAFAAMIEEEGRAS